MICQGLWVKIGELGSYTASSTDKSIINADWFYRHNIGIFDFSSKYEYAVLYQGGASAGGSGSYKLNYDITQFTHLYFMMFNQNSGTYYHDTLENYLFLCKAMSDSKSGIIMGFSTNSTYCNLVIGNNTSFFSSISKYYLPYDAMRIVGYGSYNLTIRGIRLK